MWDVLSERAWQLCIIQWKISGPSLSATLTPMTSHLCQAHSQATLSSLTPFQPFSGLWPTFSMEISNYSAASGPLWELTPNWANRRPKMTGDPNTGNSEYLPAPIPARGSSVGKQKCPSHNALCYRCPHISMYFRILYFHSP